VQARLTALSVPKLRFLVMQFVHSGTIPLTSMEQTLTLAIQGRPNSDTGGASSAAAKIYSKDGRFGPIPAGSRVLGASGGRYGA
jgi:hypothetical protein